MTGELYAAVNVNASGDNTVVSAVTNAKIRVLSYVLMSGGTVNATWKSDVGGGAVALSGAFPFTAQTGVSAAAGPSGAAGGRACHFETASGKALNLNLDANVQVSGHITYVIDRTL